VELGDAIFLQIRLQTSAPRQIRKSVALQIAAAVKMSQGEK
jgi:hypothetical protein